MITAETERLILRPPVESDRARFVELFTDETFTVFSGVHDEESANARFDRMMAFVALVPYGKQPVVEKDSGMIVGYTGVDSTMFEGLDRLEWGWRFIADARGKGYATEATLALLEVADAHSDGEVLCIIATDNLPSRRVADKAGFRWWRKVHWRDDASDPTELLTRPLGQGGAPLVAPKGL